MDRESQKYSTYSLIKSGILGLILVGCSELNQGSSKLPTPGSDTQISTVVNDAAMGDEHQGDNWLAFGRTYSEQRFSPLDQINASTVTGLTVDWFLDLPDKGGIVSTPLIVDGILYFVGGMNRVRAVDASSGEKLWEYDPKVAVHSGNDLRAGWAHNRGIGIWQNKVYQATWDGRLIALDRNNGQMIWSVRTFAADAPLYITGAPKIFKGKVLIGNGGNENGPARGYVTAYDANTGDQVWRFYVVPGDPADGFESEAMRMAAETWTGEWWKLGGGGSAWHGFTYDPELDQLYIGTGNGAPWNRKIRSPGGGDNLFLSSIVALDPDTGEYLWHYQTTPGESWDFNSNMDIVLTDLDIKGRKVKAILHAPKNGFFYVIDRTNGDLISAEPFSKTTWATHIDLATGRPVEVPGARYESGTAHVSPAPTGAHNWHAMSYNPGTGLAYIPAMHLSAVFSDEYLDHDTWKPSNFFGDTRGVRFTIEANPGDQLSTLQAFDPVRGEIAWEVPVPGLWNAGTMTTAGNLVFQGQANGEFVAYRASSGEQLWTYDLGLGISAPPVTYAIDGKQYIALLVGWGGAVPGYGSDILAALGWAYGEQTRRLVSFTLNGKTTLPSQPPPKVAQPIQIREFEVARDLAKQGEFEYLRCVYCHGLGAKAAGMAPDLRASPILSYPATFSTIVRDGALKSGGMPGFSELTDRQLLAIRHYIRQQAEIDNR